ncbi:SDR family oxidoreductase [Daejeonella sp. H1SJ63]|uniref:SDR family oxidoreductase n=1 Tax=Daejeonella sp. H1SJ63 TaxID=3034145 RepID=UPI0023EC09C7|nr:SDR family oxidoreductase [Daejeonella sp. H1SJ63]
MNAIVSGGTKGIGRAAVMHLAAIGYNVSFCSRKVGEIQELLLELEEKYPHLRFHGMKADMENMAEVRDFAEFAFKSQGTIDVLVNNAGLYLPSELLNEGDDSLERQMKVNVYAPHFLSKFFASLMKKQGKGYIFNICSVASLNPVLSAGSYSISKAALLSLTKTLRQELMSSGIKVTAIIPGSTLTDSWTGTDIPSDRFILAEDIAMSIVSCLQMSAGANIEEIIIRPLKGDI